MRKRLALEKTRGYTYNQKRDYYRKTKRPFLYIIAHRFHQKNICKALENDFGFTTNGTINRGAWDLRGIRYIRSYRVGLKEWFQKTSKQYLGCVFIVCSPRVHRPAIFIDTYRHLVLLVPAITTSTWANQSIFKRAADYLNIDINRFRPE